MPDVVAHDVADKESRQEDAHHGIEQVEPVRLCGIEVLGQERLNLMNEHLQYPRGKRREDAHQETQQEDETLFTDVLLAPTDELLKERKLSCACVHRAPPLTRESLSPLRRHPA